MKSWRLGILALLLGLVANAAAASEPRLLSIRVSPGVSSETLAAAGLDVVWSGAGEIRVLEHPGDAQRLALLGAAYRVLDEHPGRTLAARTRAELASRRATPGVHVLSAARGDGIARIETLPPFGQGSMGGFWTSAEIKMKLDLLVSSDTSDVVAAKIDTLGYTWKNRPVWGLRIGKAIQGPDTRPVVFMNALTHAREPGGMQTLFWFVDHLLSHYGSDPFAKYLLDRRVLYIVPLVNPDGYAQNESTYFGSGGMAFGYWRKNARDNDGNGTIDETHDGVDINRNFAWHWGDPGASSVPGDETYRGPSAASEPETRIQRDAVVTLQPETGLSFHTFSDLMIYPWGYTTTPPPDVAAFNEWSDELVRDNGYLSGQAPNVLYFVSGEFNDWCYGDTLAKPRMYSWTPEIGSEMDDFWPPPSRIQPLAQENLRACYTVMAIAGPYVQEDGVTIAEGAMNAGNLAHVTVRARNLGATGTAGPGLTGTLLPLDLGVTVLRGTVHYPTLGSRQSGNPDQSFQLACADTVTPGRRLRFRLEFTAPDGFFSCDTIAIPCGTPTVLVTESCDTMLVAKWSPGSWGVVKNDAAHPNRYFADSPNGAYGSNPSNTLRLFQTFDLSHVVHAYALFDARWEMEPDYDGAFVETSLNGTTWTPLPSTTTTPASGISGSQQPTPNQPVFAGARRLWRGEVTDLSSFTGAGKTAVRFRFRMSSDGGNPNGKLLDGFNLDTLRLVVYDPANQPAPVAVGDAASARAIELLPPAPNPARGGVRLSFALPRRGAARLEILDLQGRRVRTLGDRVFEAGRYAHGWDLRDDAGHGVAPGVYLARLTTPDASQVRRIVVMR